MNYLVIFENSKLHANILAEIDSKHKPNSIYKSKTNLIQFLYKRQQIYSKIGVR